MFGTLQAATTAFTLLLLSQQASAGPLRRQDAPSENQDGIPIQEYMDASIIKFLQSQNVDPNNYVPIAGGKNIDWITGDGITNEGNANAAVLDVSDKLRSNNDSVPAIFFANEYVTFLKEAQKLDPVDNSTDAQLNASANAEKKACIQDFPEVVTSTIKGYTDFGGKINGTALTDENFLQWAQANDDTFNQAKIQCTDAQTKYFQDINNLKGDNFALLSLAYENIQPLTIPESEVTPGITMEFNSSGTNVQVTSAGGSGNFAPLYNLTELTGLMESWLEQDAAGAMDGNPQFEFDSSKDSTSDITHSTSSDASVGIDWRAWGVSASASSSEDDTTLNSTATSFSITYGALALVDVSFGAWFDNYRAASAIQQGADNQTQKMQPAFEKFFGKDKNSAGAAATYNRKALIGYKPTFSMEIQDQDAYDKITDTKASASACFLIFCLGGGGSNHNEVNTTSSSDKKITYTDNRGHVLGMVTGSFWDASST